MFRLIFISLFFLSACSNPCYYFSSLPTCELSCISLVDRDGFTSTIQQPDRLAQYASVDFLSPQSYQKVMCVYSRDASGNIPASVTSYYPNGQVKQYLELENARAQGEYREWHENGAPKLESHVVGGLGDLTEEAMRSWVFDGCCKAWNSSNQLLTTIHYSMGSLEGEALYYSPSGAVVRRIPYKQNLIDGSDEIFTESGELLEMDHFVRGVREGPTRRFWTKDQIAAEESYSNDLLISGQYYQPDGTLATEVKDGHGWRALFDEHAIRQMQQYRYGLPDGEAKIFTPKGKTANSFRIKDGKKHGEETVYYPARPGDGGKLRPRLSINWYEDKIHGIVKSWFEDGSPESQREMSNNMRNGLSTAWYRNGSVMLVEEYDHDRLVKGEYYKKGDRRPESKVIDGSGLATLYDAEGNLIQKVHYYHGHILD